MSIFLFFRPLYTCSVVLVECQGRLTVCNRATIKTKRGNEVSRNGDPEDPAVILDTGKSKAIKSAHELN